MKAQPLALAGVLAVLTFFAGCTHPTIIYVDQANKNGPWDGSEAHPFKTIQEGLNKAKANAREIVEVSGGVYAENVVMKPGTLLRRGPKATTVVVQGATGKPTISASDYDAIAGLVIEGGSPAVLFKLKAEKPPVTDALTSLANCRIESYDGVRIETEGALSFGNGVHRKFDMWVSDNWLTAGPTGSGGTGIRVTLVGPKTGELNLRLHLGHNIIQQKSTAMDIEAKGQGPNPSGKVRSLASGYVENNLLFFNGTGLRLNSVNLGSADPVIFNNTIVDNASHGVVATVASGPDGDASTHPDVVNNIIARNKGFGYLELAKKTSAKGLNNNLFFQNAQGHYHDEDTGTVINDQKGLNTPIVNNKVVFISGKNNQAKDPRFTQGNFPWYGKTWGQEKAGAYFLQHGGPSPSPAIDQGLGSAMEADLNLRTTRTDFKLDGGTVDLGFHYARP